MIRTSFTLLILLFATAKTFAYGPDTESEYRYILQNESTPRHFFELRTDYYGNSNSLTNSFIDGAFGGKGAVSNEVKSDVLNYLETSNKMGYHIDYEFTYKNATLSNNFRHVFGVKSKEFTYALFNPQLFKLAFWGNKQFVGEKLNIAPFEFKYVTYEGVSWGIEKTSDTWRYSIVGSFLIGSNYQFTQINKSTFYTSPFVDTIAIDIQGDIAFTPTEMPRFSTLSGEGVSFDFNIAKKSNNGVWTLDISDVGVLYWNKRSRYSLNDTYLYTGINGDSLFAGNSASFNAIKMDSLNGFFNLAKIDEPKTMIIPFRVELNYLHNFGKLSLNGGLSHFAIPKYTPMIFAGTFYQITPSFIGKIKASYGGFGAFDYGAGLSYFYKNRWAATIETFFIEDLLYPSKSKGQGMNFAIQCMF